MRGETVQRRREVLESITRKDQERERSRGRKEAA